ncbi:hypothetical protein QWZ13_17385 [Reinekea marina]|uniref:Porin n=1 Tax=Reinekea marina TaxID=1310421 RepID=A0ABV7WP47_9GAMM|nr:hypothetical protein [Reinekea marina]MDN3650682.1 hypothetical protein [Reinekea marina]
MKAIFAVSALAAAISGQALAADTEATITYSGSMDTALTVDLNNDATKDVNLVDEEYSISMDVDVVNGPFSGSIGIEAADGDTTVNDNALTSDELVVTVGDLTVTEGNLTFGQVGNLMSTDEYAHEMAEAGTADVNAGFKYVVAEGVTVQLQNHQPATTGYGSSYGVAAQYTGSADALSYTVEGEFSGSDGAPDGSDPATFVGAGVTYTTDAFTVMAAVNNYGATDKVTEYAASIEASLAGATVTAAWTDVNTDVEQDEQLDVDASYDVSEEMGVSAGYTLTTAEETGDEVRAGATYASGMISASADVTIANFDATEADDALIELNVTYTADSGVEFYGDYDMQGDTKSMLTLGARYSF